MIFDTGFPADSVEFCPAPGHEDILACGTYKILQNESQNVNEDGSVELETQASSRHRIGKCILMRVKENEEGARRPMEFILEENSGVEVGENCPGLSERNLNIMFLDETQKYSGV